MPPGNPPAPAAVPLQASGTPVLPEERHPSSLSCTGGPESLTSKTSARAAPSGGSDTYQQVAWGSVPTLRLSFSICKMGRGGPSPSAGCEDETG